MSQPKQETPASSLSPQDILFVLFKHKGKILLCAALGIAAAAAVYFLDTPLYESQAKLLVRYVVDRSAVDPEIAGSPGKDAINSEVQIFTSWDLATQAADAIGARRLLPEAKGVVTTAAAARTIRSGLAATPAGKGSNVIVVSYKNRDPELANLVLNELISQYFVKHLDVHRSAEAFNFVAQQSDQVKARLDQTEEELKRIKSKVAVTSLTESTALINAELSSSQNALQAAKAEYAEQSARVEEMEKSLAAQDKDTPAATPPVIDSEAVQKYRALIGQLDNLRHVQMELLAKYSEKAGQPVVPDEIQRTRQIRSLDQRAKDKRGQDLVAAGRALRLGFVGAERDMALAMARERYRQQNATGFDYQAGKKDFDTLVKEAEDEILGKRAATSQADKDSQLELVRINQMQIENLEQQRSDLEKRYPETVAAATAGLASPSNQSNLLGERARLAGIEARTRALESHLSQVKKRAEQLAEVGPQIAQLERAKEIEENNYKYFQASLEKARVDEALDPSKIPNISVVQKPSPAMRVTTDLTKIVLGLAGGGVAFGLALAFVIELVLDRTVKRPVEVEKLLGAPILLSIPYLNGRSHLRLRWPTSQKAIVLQRNGHSSVAPWEADHFIWPYSEAIRDRLVLYFELNRMNHKPKLVAVTGCSDGAGASTLAGGIAAALSETGDGKVLLVDMNVGRPEIHPFFRGAPASSLTEALVGEPAQAGENLYLATATPTDAGQAQLVPRKFYDLMPHLKASDFDYIIFDLPPFSPTSITLPMARFMDKVVLVAEAEKSSRDVVKRAQRELASVGTSISVILNKARSYAPKWIGAEG